MSEEVVLDLCVNGLAVITIDRPKALNACNVKMVRELRAALAKCREGEAKAVLLQGAGDKGLSSGGDVKALHGFLTTDATSDTPKDQMFEEYNAVFDFAQLAIPTVAIAHGITMGFGLGLSASARYSVATEKSRMAMPENNIGLFPDAGFSYYAASVLPPGVGRLLALTCAHLVGAGDVIAAKLASHFVPMEKLPDLTQALRTADLSGDADAALRQAVEAFAQAAPEPQRLVKDCWLLPRFATLSSLNQLYSLMDEATETSDDSWEQELYGALRRGSPFSQAVTLRLLQLAEADAAAGIPGPLRLAKALDRDFAAACRIPYRSDFVEGLRAVLVDKDNKPKWRPAQYQEVSRDEVEAAISPLAEGERVLGLVV